MADWVFIPDEVKSMLYYISLRLNRSEKEVLADLIRDYYWNLKDLEEKVDGYSECSGNWKGANDEDK